MSMDEIFKKATNHVRSLSNVDEKDMLMLYGLYKQSIEGPCNIPKPYFWDFTAKAKWNSWTKCSDLSKETAMLNYVELVQKLDKSWDKYSEITESSAKRHEGMGISVSTMYNVKNEDDIEEHNKTVFNYCEAGDLEQIKTFLVQSPSLLNSKDDDGVSLLHWAVDRGHIDIVSYLISSKCDINIVDSELQTCLHYAVTCDRIEIVKLMLEAGADTYLTDVDGNTALDCSENADISKCFK